VYLGFYFLPPLLQPTATMRWVAAAAAGNKNRGTPDNRDAWYWFA